jgi:hypothetical protein
MSRSLLGEEVYPELKDSNKQIRTDRNVGSSVREWGL